MTETEHHDGHIVSHHHFDALKADYCRRCGLPISPSERHDHDDEEPTER
ncbi:hypothetical protein [Agromyces sp. LHK192]|nr:hypothetical protein [Agromyces sp. LHK192]